MTLQTLVPSHTLTLLTLTWAVLFLGRCRHKCGHYLGVLGLKQVLLVCTLVLRSITGSSQGIARFHLGINHRGVGSLSRLLLEQPLQDILCQELLFLWVPACSKDTGTDLPASRQSLPWPLVSTAVCRDTSSSCAVLMMSRFCLPPFR